MRDYYSLSADQTLEELGSERRGLSREAAAGRLQKAGPNALRQKGRDSLFKLFLSQFTDLMVLLLIAAAAISAVLAFLTGDRQELFDTFIIIFIIFLNAVVGFVQQVRADRAIERLKQLSAGKARVRREGAEAVIPAEEVVPGDILLLEEGDRVAADCRVLTANALSVDESALTGESLPSVKTAAPLKEGLALGDRKNMLYGSTFVVRGNGEAVAVRTGMETEIGRIADLLDRSETVATPLQRSLATLGKVISVTVIAVAAVIFVFGLFFQHHPLMQTFMTAVAIAVAAIPEGMPAVVTIIMALGVQRMSRSRAIVRKLHAVETLGSCDVICSDKTGTLTLNAMTVRRTLTADGDRAVPRADTAAWWMYACMRVCHSVKGGKGSYLGDPTEVALLTECDRAGFPAPAFVRTGERPFESERKLMSVAGKLNGKALVFVKGAPDVLLGRCSRIFEGGRIRPLTEADRSRLAAGNAVMGREALRVLGFAMAEGELREEGLTFLGLCGMMDPPRPEARAAVAECKRAGIVPVMMTGDHRETAFAVARELGICNDLSRVITGAELDRLTPAQLEKTVTAYRVFARVSPKHKTAVVEALQKRGKVVAMTGDGINDAPGIKRADIGVAMGSGTDVTKDASDMIIADDNFATIVLAVREGRRVFSNIKKTIQFFLATNLAEVFAILLATLFFPQFTYLISTQLLWINLITDTFPVLALGAEREEPDIMDRPPERAEKALFSRTSVLSTAVYGGIQTVLVLGVFLFALSCYGNAVASCMTFFTLSFVELFHAFNIRSERRSAFGRGMGGNRTMLLTVLLGVGVNLLLCLIPPLCGAFAIVPLTLPQWGIVFGAALAVIPAAEAFKAVLRRGRHA